MIHTRKWLIFAMCIVMGNFTAGCYSVNAVQLSESQTIAGKDLFAETTLDGRSLRYHEGDLDSLQISRITVSRFLNGRVIGSAPIDSVRSIETKSFNWPGTIGLSMLSFTVIAYFIVVSSVKGMRI